MQTIIEQPPTAVDMFVDMQLLPRKDWSAVLNNKRHKYDNYECLVDFWRKACFEVGGNTAATTKRIKGRDDERIFPNTAAVRSLSVFCSGQLQSKLEVINKELEKMPYHLDNELARLFVVSVWAQACTALAQSTDQAEVDAECLRIRKQLSAVFGSWLDKLLDMNRRVQEIEREPDLGFMASGFPIFDRAC